jgi:plasmid stabilization system protein ParE
MGSFTIRLRGRALADVSKIRAWYRKIDPSLEDRFLESLNNGLDRIEARPLTYQAIYRNTRRALLYKFPYSIYYVVVDSRIIVLAVIHHKRNPEIAQGIAE